MSERLGMISPEDIIRHNGDVQAVLEEKRTVAGEIQKQTGSLPDWWDLQVSLDGKGQYSRPGGAPRKFSSVEEYMSLGYEYLEECAKRDRFPTKAGLILHLGFPSEPNWYQHARRNPEFREALSTLLLWLRLAYESVVHEPGGQAGKMFVLKNIPDGLSVEDPTDKRMTHSWKERQVTELTGEDGAPIEFSAKVDPLEAYRRMLEGGTLAEAPDDEDDA